MARRLVLQFGLIVVLLLIFAMPALAGGWAVVTLDQLPTQVIVAEPLAIGFTVRQHGHRPMNGLTPTITALHVDSDASFKVSARQEGAPGHYVATLTFPSPGAWHWTIDAFTFAQPMPALTVLATQPAPNAKAAAPFSLGLVLGVAGLAGATAAGLVALRTRARYAPAVALVALAISVSGFGRAAEQPGLVAAEPTHVDRTTLGRDLFLAKGCVVCHRHAAVADAREALRSFSVGPDLTNWGADPEFLRRWLTNPVAVRPNTQMPTLGLRDDEIEALIAFLTAKEDQ